MSGFIKLLASMGIPIPRLADWLFVKEYSICSHANNINIRTKRKVCSIMLNAASVETTIHQTVSCVTNSDTLVMLCEQANICHDRDVSIVSSQITEWLIAIM